MRASCARGPARWCGLGLWGNISVPARAQSDSQTVQCVVSPHLVAAVDDDGVGGEVVGRSRQKVVEDAGAEARAVRVDGRPVETHHLDQWCDLVRLSDPAVNIAQRLRQLRDRPGPGVDPGQRGQTGEYVLSQLQELQTPG